MDGARKRKVELSHQQKLDILNKLAAGRSPNVRFLLTLLNSTRRVIAQKSSVCI